MTDVLTIARMIESLRRAETASSYSPRQSSQHEHIVRNLSKKSRAEVYATMCSLLPGLVARDLEEARAALENLGVNTDTVRTAADIAAALAPPG